MHQSENIKIKLITIINKDEYSWLILLYARVNENTLSLQTDPDQLASVGPVVQSIISLCKLSNLQVFLLKKCEYKGRAKVLSLIGLLSFIPGIF